MSEKIISKPDDWITYESGKTSDPPRIALGLLIINAVTLALLCPASVYVFLAIKEKIPRRKYEYSGYRKICVFALILYTLHITSNIIFLALWGENNFDYNTINLLPFILRALSLCLIILVIWAVSPELETGGSESMLLKPSAVLGCLVMVETVLRIALKIATSVFSDVFEGPADVLEIIYATTITLLVVMVCWVCVRSIARMRSSSSSSSSSGGADTTPATPAAAAAGRSLVAWVSLLTISSVTYTLTHLVFASYFRIVEPPISPPTALALNAIRLLGPAIALVSVLGISLCRPIRDDPCTATTATATTTATITASTATADDDTITPSESKEKKEVV